MLLRQLDLSAGRPVATTAGVVIPWHLGDVIRKLREGRRWSLRYMSRNYKVGYTTLSELENGETLETYKAQTLRKVAGAFSATEGELLDAVPLKRGLSRQHRRIVEALPEAMTDTTCDVILVAIATAVRGGTGRGSPPVPKGSPGPRRSAGGSR